LVAAVVVSCVGGSETAAAIGVTEAEAIEAALSPAELVATTANV